jgi:hypothetical protein
MIKKIFPLMGMVVLTATLHAQSLLSSSLTMEESRIGYYFEYNNLVFNRLETMYPEFEQLSDPELMSVYYKHQKVNRLASALAVLAGAQVGFGVTGLVIEQDRVGKPMLYTVLGTGLLSVGITAWLDRRGRRHARNAVKRYNSLNKVMGIF